MVQRGKCPGHDVAKLVLVCDADEVGELGTISFGGHGDCKFVRSVGQQSGMKGSGSACIHAARDWLPR